MVNHLTAKLDLTFKALADPTRRAILDRLAQGGASVTELAEPFSISLPAISKQLRVLESAGLVVKEKQGRVRWCRLVAGPMKEVADWLIRYQSYWEGQLDSLANYLEEYQREDESP